jgi:hypothetical protein
MRQAISENSVVSPVKVTVSLTGLAGIELEKDVGVAVVPTLGTVLGIAFNVVPTHGDHAAPALRCVHGGYGSKP